MVSSISVSTDVVTMDVVTASTPSVANAGNDNARAATQAIAIILVFIAILLIFTKSFKYGLYDESIVRFFILSSHDHHAQIMV